MEEYELQLVSANSENQKLQRSADLFQKRFDALQTESTALEVENSKLQKTVDSLRNSLRRLNELEKENTDLETDNHRIDRESKGLHKEIARLKQAIEVLICLFSLFPRSYLGHPLASFFPTRPEHLAGSWLGLSNGAERAGVMDGICAGPISHMKRGRRSFKGTASLG